MSDTVYFVTITILIPYNSSSNPLIFLISDWKIYKKGQRIKMNIKLLVKKNKTKQRQKNFFQKVI